MGNSQVSYDEFYMKGTDGALHLKSLEWLLAELPNYPNAESIQLYSRRFCNRMLCPDCKQARLKLVRARSATGSPFLQAIDNGEHASGCYYKHPPMNADKAAKAVDDLSEAEREEKLDSMIARLVKESAETSDPAPAGSTPTATARIIPTSATEHGGSKRLPQKKINALARVTEDCYYLVYGEADISEEPRDGWVKIWFGNESEKNLLDVSCSQPVYSHIAKSGDYRQAIANGRCYMAAFCDIKIHRCNNALYRRCPINHSSKIKVVPIP